MLGRHRKAVQPAFDVQGAIVNCRTAIKWIGRAMDLCDEQEVAAWRFIANERGRQVELDDMEIRLLRGSLAAMRREAVL